MKQLLASELDKFILGSELNEYDLEQLNENDKDVMYNTASKSELNAIDVDKIYNMVTNRDDINNKTLLELGKLVAGWEINTMFDFGLHKPKYKFTKENAIKCHEIFVSIMQTLYDRLEFGDTEIDNNINDIKKDRELKDPLSYNMFE